MTTKEVLQAAEEAAALVYAAEHYCLRHQVLMDPTRAEDVLAIWELMVAEGFKKIARLSRTLPVATYPRSRAFVSTPRADHLTQIAHLATYYTQIEHWRLALIKAQWEDSQTSLEETA